MFFALENFHFKNIKTKETWKTKKKNKPRWNTFMTKY